MARPWGASTPRTQRAQPHSWERSHIFSHSLRRCALVVGIAAGSLFVATFPAQSQSSAGTPIQSDNPTCIKGSRLEPKGAYVTIYANTLRPNGFMSLRRGAVMTVLGQGTLKAANGSSYTTCWVQTSNGAWGLIVDPQDVQPAPAADTSQPASADGDFCSNSANLTDNDIKMACAVAVAMCIPSASVGEGAHRACMNRLMKGAGRSQSHSSENASDPQLRHGYGQAHNVFEACWTNPTIQTCTEAIRSEGLSARERSRAYAWRALARGEQDYLDTSGLVIADCEAAIRLDPNDGVGYFVRAGLYANRLSRSMRDKQLLAMTVADTDRAIERNLPAELLARAYKTRGEAYQMAALFVSGEEQFGYYRKSIEDFSELIRLTPGDAQAYEQRGFDEKVLGELQASHDDVRTAKRIDPNVKINFEDAGKN